MFDLIWTFFETGNIELLKPILSIGIQSRVSQELFVWGIVFWVMKKQTKTFIAEAKKELTEAKQSVSVEVSGVKDAIHTLTSTIQRVEAEHFSATKQTNDRVQRQADVQKDLGNRQQSFDNLLTRALRRIGWMEDVIHAKLGVIPPNDSVENNTSPA